MKVYNHTKGIILKKNNIMYADRITGLIISSEHLFWYNDENTHEKYCLIPVKDSYNSKRYSFKEFHEDFRPYISRFDELKNESKKFKTVTYAEYVNDVAKGNKSYIDYLADELDLNTPKQSIKTTTFRISGS